jgi:hypothetical protein
VSSATKVYILTILLAFVCSSIGNFSAVPSLDQMRPKTRHYVALSVVGHAYSIIFENMAALMRHATKQQWFGPKDDVAVQQTNNCSSLVSMPPMPIATNSRSHSALLSICFDLNELKQHAQRFCSTKNNNK